jgi:DNA-binding CsgD family transcriptional regulator
MILTELEKKIIKLVYEKKSSREIYKILGVTPNSVNSHIYQLNRYYPSKNRFELAKKLMNKIMLEEKYEQLKETKDS